MQNNLIKAWGLEPLHVYNYYQSPTQTISQTISANQRKPIIKLPLQFTFPPVQIISKQLTKLNSKHKERIIYLGPRWNDSVIWHKKYSKQLNRRTTQQAESVLQNFSSYGYYFNQKRVARNNSFIQVKNKTYLIGFYEIKSFFQELRMNPTLDQDQQLIFQSRFESGNLDCYDIFMRIDTNTRGNLFWYHFQIWFKENCKLENKKIKLNICNITKTKTLYQKNLKPYIKRFKQNGKSTKSYKPYENWIQGEGIQNCIFKQRKLRYKFIYDKIKVPNLYELSFQIEIRKKQKTSLAYCIPFTYSDLLSQMRFLQQQIKSRSIKNILIKKLCQSLTGVQIPIIVIGDLNDVQNQDQKKVIFITGRIHPGQSNSSLILTSLLNQLCLKKLEKAIEKRVVFFIIPMLNPDGVIFGNGRCSALGRDLNREFKTWNTNLNPQIVALKKLIDKIQQTHQIDIYFDFHGHSKKKNVFFFGPSYPVTQPNYYKCRIFPKIFSKNLQFFRYFGCSYSISQSKKATARAVMINQFGIPFFYTVETSIGFFHDYSKREDIPFGKDNLFKIGIKFKQSLKQYFEGVEEYEQFLKGKRKDKNIKNQSFSFKNIIEKQFQSKPPNQDQQKIFQLKYIRVFQQIKTQAKISQKNNKKQTSQSDSDSCRASQQLQLQKGKEFASMLNTFNKIQQQRIQNISNNLINFTSENQLKLKHQKKSKMKHHSQINEQINSFIKKLTATKNEFRVHSNSLKIDFRQENIKSRQIQRIDQDLQIEMRENQLLSKQSKKLKSSIPIKKLNDLTVTAHNFFRKNQLQIFGQEESTMGIVNFSKMIQNPKSLRYSQDNNPLHNKKHKSQKRKILSTNFEIQRAKNNNTSLIKNLELFPGEKSDYQIQRNYQIEKFQNRQSSLSNSAAIKPYPASFYRIKYQTSHKRYRDKSPDVSFSNFKRNLQEKRNIIININEQTKVTKKKQNINRQPQKLFINISKIQN